MFKYPLSCTFCKVFSCFLQKGTNTSWEYVFNIEDAELWEMYFSVEWRVSYQDYYSYQWLISQAISSPFGLELQTHTAMGVKLWNMFPTHLFSHKRTRPLMCLPAFPPWRTEHFLEQGLPAISTILGLLCFQMEISVISFNCSVNCFSCWCRYSFLAHSKAWATGMILAKACGKK